jgi:choline dehydrogenase-like flavoprotein
VDLDAVVEGLKFVRDVTRGLEFIVEEERPGEQIKNDEQLRQYVKNHAWGHHASCTCAIGKETENGVLDSAFRVHGVKGLRVVDASIFPRIPVFSSSHRYT